MGSSRFSRRRRCTLTGALVIVAAFGGACGDDEKGPTEAKADFAAYCDASYDLETYFAEDPDVDFETATPEQVSAALATYLQGAKPLVDAVVPLAPAEIKEPIDVQVAAFNQALAGADPNEVFGTPENKAAEAEAHAFDLKNCGWGKVKVSGDEYSFSGLPGELKAGRTSIDFTNEGKELHEIVLLVKNPGVTETFDQIIELPEEQGITKVRPVAQAFAAQDEGDYVVADLAPGEYLAVCFIPQGLLSQDGPPPADDAKSHAQLGMKKEITVK
jgi:uncharacterized cupredoxin-like copper-binding protein